VLSVSPYAAATSPSISIGYAKPDPIRDQQSVEHISPSSVSPTTGVLTGLHTAPGYPTSGAADYSSGARGRSGDFVLVDPQAPKLVYAGSDNVPDGGRFHSPPRLGGVLTLATRPGAGNDPFT